MLLKKGIGEYPTLICQQPSKIFYDLFVANARCGENISLGILQCQAKENYQILLKFDFSYISRSSKDKLYHSRSIKQILLEKEIVQIKNIISFLPISNEEEPLCRKMMRCVVLEHSLLLFRRMREK